MVNMLACRKLSGDSYHGSGKGEALSTMKSSLNPIASMQHEKGKLIF